MDIEASALRDGGRLKDIRAFIDRLYDPSSTVCSEKHKSISALGF
jgi:hypothetical protein